MDEIIIVDYDPCWQKLFKEEAARVWKTLGNDMVVAIEHIGSTAVPGLAAKPVIDLMIGVHSVENARSAVPLLETLEYIYWQENPCPERMFFVKGMPPYGKQRTHHIHIVRAYSEFWERLLFRDYLRTHPDEAKRYATLKRNLAQRFHADRESYTDGKSNYIQAVMEKAHREQTIQNKIR